MKAIVVIPEGKIALGKLAQAVMYMVQKSFQLKETLTKLKYRKKVAEKGEIALVNSVNP